jgi:inhibitor of KinA
MPPFSSDSNKIAIFVYGTLQRGGANDITKLNPTPVWIGHGCIRGRLFDLGHCPAFVLDESGGLVWGEVYEISREHFEALNKWEAQCGEFHLRQANVTTKNGHLSCFIYESGLSQIGNAKEVTVGRWPLMRKLNAGQIFPVGDCALMVDFSAEAQTHKLSMIHGFSTALRRLSVHGVRDIVEAPNSVTLHYAPEKVPCEQGEMPSELLLRKLLEMEIVPFEGQGATHIIPVCYEADFAQDLLDVANLHGITVESFINEHCNQVYTVASLGFLPGFAYLEGLPKRLHTPRLVTPRARVPIGSVAMGNEFTGIYPEESPGGWRIVGRTNVKLFNPLDVNPSLFKAGDQVSFRRISIDEFSSLT